MLLTFFIFSMKIVSKIFYFDLLTIVLRVSINMTLQFIRMFHPLDCLIFTMIRTEYLLFMDEGPSSSALKNI